MRPVRLSLTLALVLAGCASSPAASDPPPPPPPPPRVALRVLFTTLEVIDDKEDGSGDWRVLVRVDGHALGTSVLGEANSHGAVAIEREAHSEGLERDHHVIINAKVEEYDGGFDNTWNLIGEKTLVFGPRDRWGIGAHEMQMETDEGKVKLHVQVLRATPTGVDTQASKSDDDPEAPDVGNPAPGR